MVDTPHDPHQLGILLVTADDEEANLITQALAPLAHDEFRTGFSLRRARTFRDGLLFARDQEPDIVLLDLVLPDISPDRSIRTFLGEQPDALIIAVSSETDLGTVRQAVRDGAAACIRKVPADYATLPGLVIAAIERYGLQTRRSFRVLVAEDGPASRVLVASMKAVDPSLQARVVRSLMEVEGVLDGPAELAPDGIILDLDLEDSHREDTFWAVIRRAGRIPIAVVTGYGPEDLPGLHLIARIAPVYRKPDLNPAGILAGLKARANALQDDTDLREQVGAATEAVVEARRATDAATVELRNALAPVKAIVDRWT